MYKHILLIFGSLVCGAVSAQSYTSEYVPDITGNITTDTCRDITYANVQIRTIDDKTYPAGLSQLDEITNKPIILIRKDVTSFLPKKAVAFIEMHECAHHFLGHVFYNDAYSSSEPSQKLAERNADCMAAEWYTRKFGEAELTKTLSILSGSDEIGPHQSDIRNTRILSCSALTQVVY